MLKLFSCFVLFFNLLVFASVKIDINSGVARVATFVVISKTNNEWQEVIKNNLTSCKRFVFFSSKGNFKTLRKAGIDMAIEIIGNNIKVIDIMQNKVLKNFTIDGNITIPVADKISNLIYEIWFKEPGIFQNTILFYSNIGKTQAAIGKVRIDGNQMQYISPPIAYLGSCSLNAGKVLLSKFDIKKRGFVTMEFDPDNKTFKRLVSIRSASIYSPVVMGNNILVAASYKGTTGIYSAPYRVLNFSSFYQFVNSPEVREISKSYGKISTAASFKNNFLAYCSNASGRPQIFMYPNNKISQNPGSYYDPEISPDASKVAAIKIYQNQFNLVVIDLKTKKEQTLLQNYFIGRPSWSPCGNWLASEIRNQGKKSVINLIHISGKYMKIIEGKFSVSHPLWLRNKNN